MRLRQLGQTGTEYMTVISVVVVAVVGGSYAFVSRFQDGVDKLAYDIKETLSTGSFRGQGRVNATVHNTATNSNTLVEGGEQTGTTMTIGLPFVGDMDLGPVIQAARLAQQRMNGGPPPTGIGRNSCPIWVVSYILNEHGVPGTDMQTLMEIAEDPANRSALLLDCKADSSGSCTDLSMDFIGLNGLARRVGREGEPNPHRGAHGSSEASKEWLEAELGKGAHPAVLLTDEHGQPHWVVMTDVQRDRETGVITGYTYVDGRSGEPKQISRGELQDSWARQGNVAVSFGAPGRAQASAN